MTPQQQQLFGIDKLKIPRSTIPAVTHVDYSARIQTVHKETNPRYYDLIRHFERQTGSAVILNTSFNVRDEPIVCRPEDAYRCFMHTEMDYLVMENFLLAKHEQPLLAKTQDRKKEFEVIQNKNYQNEKSEPNKKELRNFGLITGTIIAVLFGLIMPLIREHSLVVWPWLIATILSLSAILVPTKLNRLYQIWMKIGFALGWINTRIILGIIFYSVITPIGSILRLLKHDPMLRKFDANTQTYRLNCEVKSKKRMEKTY
jgi:hypothetical protein